MTYYWNPNAMAEFDAESLVLRIPSSGHYARVEGPIVELLSQLPFSDVEDAVKVWENRCGRGDLTVKNASVIWHELCDMGAICTADFVEPVNEHDKSQWVSLDPRAVHSHLHRFMDAHDFMADDDSVSLGA